LPTDNPAWHRLARDNMEAAWVILLLVNLAAILVWPSWETIPFHLISICFTLLFGLRVWSAGPMLWGVGIVLITTLTGLALDVLHDARAVEETLDIPLLATMFVAMVWHANRRIAADQERQLIGEQHARLLTMQRRFLQDASHHLRTPITIALTHAELLARGLTGSQEQHDVQMVIAELNRLRRLSERLLVIAASEDPEFLRSEPVVLDEFVMETFERWLPTVQRRWQLGRLDPATVLADEERLGLALDALLENAVKYTSADDVIELSVICDQPGRARVIVGDAGSGISSSELAHIFERFRTGGSPQGTRGTGLGLAVVRAVADAHGGSAQVRSVLGEGSEFEILLPMAVMSRNQLDYIYITDTSRDFLDKHPQRAIRSNKLGYP
jgi:signal transduction histidine kinase